MKTLTKMDMIRALVESEKVNELKKDENESIESLAARLYRSVSSEEVKTLYTERIAQDPVEAIEKVAEKAEKVVSAVEKPKKAAKKKVSSKTLTKAEKKAQEEFEKSRIESRESEEERKALYAPVINEQGITMKAWISDLIVQHEFKFTKKGKYELKLEHHSIIYNPEKNRFDIVYNEDKKTTIFYTLALCPFMIRSFLKKYGISLEKGDLKEKVLSTKIGRQINKA